MSITEPQLARLLSVQPSPGRGSAPSAAELVVRFDAARGRARVQNSRLALPFGSRARLYRVDGKARLTVGPRRCTVRHADGSTTDLVVRCRIQGLREGFEEVLVERLASAESPDLAFWLYAEECLQRRVRELTYDHSRFMEPAAPHGLDRIGLSTIECQEGLTSALHDELGLRAVVRIVRADYGDAFGLHSPEFEVAAKDTDARFLMSFETQLQAAAGQTRFDGLERPLAPGVLMRGIRHIIQGLVAERADEELLVGDPDALAAALLEWGLHADIRSEGLAREGMRLRVRRAELAQETGPSAEARSSDPLEGPIGLAATARASVSDGGTPSVRAHLSLALDDEEYASADRAISIRLGMELGLALSEDEHPPGWEEGLKRDLRKHLAALVAWLPASALHLDFEDSDCLQDVSGILAAWRSKSPRMVIEESLVARLEEVPEVIAAMVRVLPAPHPSRPAYDALLAAGEQSTLIEPEPENPLAMAPAFRMRWSVVRAAPRGWEALQRFLAKGWGREPESHLEAIGAALAAPAYDAQSAFLAEALAGMSSERMVWRARAIREVASSHGLIVTIARLDRVDRDASEGRS